MPISPAMLELLPRLRAMPQVEPPMVRPRRCSAKVVLLACTVLLVLHVMLALIAETSPTLRDPAGGDKLKTWRTLSQRPGIKMIQFGSSRTLLGFRPSVIEAELSMPTVAMNFGLPASGLFTSAVSLQRVLSNGPSPDVVFVELLPTMLMDGVEEQFLTTERLSDGERKLVKSLGFNDSITGQKYIQRWAAPWFALRTQLVGRLMPSWLPEDNRHDWGRKTDDSGWTTPPRQSIDSGERAEREDKVWHEYSGLLATLNPGTRAMNVARWLEQMCTERGIRLVFVLMPEGSNFREMYGPGAENRLQLWLKQLNKPVIDARRWLDDTEMYDGHHAFARGADRFTTRLTHEAISGGQR